VNLTSAPETSEPQPLCSKLPFRRICIAAQSLKQQYRQHAVVPDGTAAPRLPIQLMLGFGAVSGLIAQTVTYPLDVVRRRMQARVHVSILLICCARI